MMDHQLLQLSKLVGITGGGVGLATLIYNQFPTDNKIKAGVVTPQPKYTKELALQYYPSHYSYLFGKFVYSLVFPGISFWNELRLVALDSPSLPNVVDNPHEAFAVLYFEYQRTVDLLQSMVHCAFSTCVWMGTWAYLCRDWGLCLGAVHPLLAILVLRSFDPTPQVTSDVRGFLLNYASQIPMLQAPTAANAIVLAISNNNLGQLTEQLVNQGRQHLPQLTNDVIQVAHTSCLRQRQEIYYLLTWYAYLGIVLEFAPLGISGAAQDILMQRSITIFAREIAYRFTFECMRGYGYDPITSRCVVEVIGFCMIAFTQLPP